MTQFLLKILDDNQFFHSDWASLPQLNKQPAFRPCSIHRYFVLKYNSSMKNSQAAGAQLIGD